MQARNHYGASHEYKACMEHVTSTSWHERQGPSRALLSKQDPRLNRNPVHRQQTVIIRVQRDLDLHLAFRQSPDVHPWPVEPCDLSPVHVDMCMTFARYMGSTGIRGRKREACRHHVQVPAFIRVLLHQDVHRRRIALRQVQHFVMVMASAGFLADAILVQKAVIRMHVAIKRHAVSRCQHEANAAAERQSDDEQGEGTVQEARSSSLDHSAAEKSPSSAQETRPAPRTRAANRAPSSVGAGPEKLPGSGAPMTCGASSRTAAAPQASHPCPKARSHMAAPAENTVANHHTCLGNMSAAATPGTSGARENAGASSTATKPATPQSMPLRREITAPRPSASAMSATRINAYPAYVSMLKITLNPSRTGSNPNSGGSAGLEAAPKCTSSPPS